METDKSKVAAVMSFNSVMEAQLYKALLESAGIQARMQNDLAAQVIPAYGALMQINLLVAEEDQKKAREILGAKFDIDEFHRQANNSGINPARREPKKEKPSGKAAKQPAVKTAKKPTEKETGKTAKKPVAKTVAAPKAPAAKKATVAKKADKPKKETADTEK